MGTLADIVNVKISLNTSSIPRAIGIAMIASPLASFAERTRTYTAYDSSNPDNLPPSVMTALSDAFAQTPKPARVKVGRLSIAKAVISPVDAVAAGIYSLKLGTTLVSVTAAASPTVASISTQLASAINTAALGVTATAVAGTVELTYTGDIIPATTFTKVQWGAITPSATAGIVDSDLGAIQAADSSWYVLHMTERTKQRVLDAAEWIETQDKLFVTATAEAGVLVSATTTDIISTLKSLGYFRTAIAYHSMANTEFADVAWAARCLSIAPGGETWALKKLSSVTSDNLSETDRTTIFAKGGNTFERYSDTLALTNPGKVVSGEWIDIIRFRDWLKDYIQTSMVQLMINRDKVPYTDGGIQLLANNLRASLREGQRVGGIAPDETNADGDPNPGWNVEVPLASEIDSTTKASRAVYLKFNARVAGAIHVADITGSLSYDPITV